MAKKAKKPAGAAAWVKAETKEHGKAVGAVVKKVAKKG